MKQMTLILTFLVLWLAASGARPGFAKPNEGLNLSHVIAPVSPEHMAKIEEAQADYRDGEAALRAKDFVNAEANFRASLALFPGEAYLGLAEALTAQGRTAEAIQTYRLMFKPNPACGFGGSYITRTYLNYALLLDQTGQWAEAVAAYQYALPTLPGGVLPKINARFDPDAPQPVALAAAVHVALGLDASFVPEDGEEYEQSQGRAFQEYAKALQLAPNWDSANYYYGYGWQRLDHKSRARIGSVQQARAALQKAILMGRADVKEAARKTLRDLNKPAGKPTNKPA